MVSNLPHPFHEEVELLKGAWSSYRQACYGTRALLEQQEQECRQAFLSGVHWLNAQESYDPESIHNASRELLKERMQ